MLRSDIVFDIFVCCRIELQLRVRTLVRCFLRTWYNNITCNNHDWTVPLDYWLIALCVNVYYMGYLFLVH